MFDTLERNQNDYVWTGFYFFLSFSMIYTEIAWAWYRNLDIGII